MKIFNLLCLVLPLATSAFMVHPTKRQTVRMAITSSRSQQGVDRKTALAQVAGVSLLSSFLLTSQPAQAKIGSSFEENIAYVLLAKKVLTPVRKYIKIGQYDVARSNIKYVTNQFRIKKNMEKAVAEALGRDVDQDKIDAAAELTAVIDNTLSQLDSSAYTMLFIPSEGSDIAPDALKYQKQAFEFYDAVMDTVDKVLALASADEIKEAEKIGNKVELPPFLFKEFNGEFYRPATP